MPAIGKYAHEDDIGNWPVTNSSTANFNPTDVNIIDNKIAVGIDVLTGSLIQFTSTGVLPAPLIYGQKYYSVKIDSTHCGVALNPVNAVAGTKIDLTAIGSGVHTINVGLGSSTSDRQETIDRAENLVETVTRDLYYPAVLLLTLDGNGKSRLFLGLTPKILTITKVEDGGIEVPIDYIDFDDDSIFLDPDVASGDIVEYHYRMRIQECLFPVGEKNITVTGTYGHATCPPGIKKAVIMLCEAENDLTLYQRYAPGVQSENTDGYSYARTRRYISGVVEVDRVLYPFISRKPVLGAA
jgi:hypothetical protein